MVKILAAYFILVQLFGAIIFGFKAFPNLQNGETIYIFVGFPIFALLYFWNLNGLMKEMEKTDQEKFESTIPEHPLRKTKAIDVSTLFSSLILTNWPEQAEKIKLTRWCLIFLLLSFALAAFNLVLTASN